MEELSMRGDKDEVERLLNEEVRFPILLRNTINLSFREQIQMAPLQRDYPYCH